jgi:hypothetical protein
VIQYSESTTLLMDGNRKEFEGFIPVKDLMDSVSL